jgi:cytochrome b involved in lipid metabolism
MIPARRVLLEASARNLELGHENHGFLSEEAGFMPRVAPLASLPASHRAWDDAAASLPELFRTLGLRRALDRMPLLSAEDLPPRYLHRASTIFSIFAHAYHYVETNPPERIPDSVLKPWAEISRRLDRKGPFLSFIDMNAYNWRLFDPNAPDPMRLENMALLIPIVGNEDERRFQCVPNEILARFTPVLNAIVRAQEAVAADDRDAFAAELEVIRRGIDLISYDSFDKVNPNANSPTYVNPVVWGKTVAPIATPFQAVDPPPGPSGTAIPSFQMMDIFFGRNAFAGNVGHESVRARAWYPRHWREFLDALEQIDVPAWIERTQDERLAALFRDTLDAYAADSGLLGRHRLKTFGYLDLSFKAGRTKTLGGFGGTFNDRAWDKMDDHLDHARNERFGRAPKAHHHLKVARVIDGPVIEVVLDVSGTGIRHLPGDRCSILPENGDAIVQRTLEALRARGEEPIQLTPAWISQIELREGFEGARVLPLRTLLRFGRLRPVQRPIAKLLYALSRHEKLRRIIEARAEDQWELSQILELVARDGFQTKRLWKAYPGERESICRVVPPESFRTYSIASWSPDEIRLHVAKLEYSTEQTEVSEAGRAQGTASAFLASSPKRLTVRIEHPPRFGLPRDPRVPMVMFAGGTGIAPFAGMLAARRAQGETGRNWLFYGTRTAHELGDLKTQDNLRITVGLSREGEKKYVDQLMLEEPNASELKRLAEAGAYFYVCGRTRFASAIMEAMRKIVGSERALVRLVGEERLLLEIFTTYSGPHYAEKRSYEASELARHNNHEDGFWVAIRGRVYDLSRFAHLHPGGLKIIHSYAGMDATPAYDRVLHNQNPEVDAMLGMYEIGALRRLDFGSAWTLAVSPDAKGLDCVSIEDLYRAWIVALFNLVEMENAMANDFTIAREPLTHDEREGKIASSPYRTQLLMQAHTRFHTDYLRDVTGPKLERLWALTSSLDGEHRDVRWMKWRMGEAHAKAIDPATDDVASLEREDKACMRALKDALRSGIALFETHERDIAERAGRELIAVACGLPSIVEAYYARLEELQDGETDHQHR